MGSFKTCVTRERGEGRLTKKITTSDIGEVLAAQKCDATYSKNPEIFGVTFFLNDPYDDVLLSYISMSVFVDAVISFL